LGIDLIILSSLKNVTSISDYSIAQKVFIIPIAFYSVLLSAWWPNITRSFEEGRIYNQTRTCIINIFIGISISILIWSIFYFNFWSINYKLFGRDVNIGGDIWSLFLLYIIIRIWTDTYTTILLATNTIKIVTSTAIVQACISVPLQIYLGVNYGAVGLIIGIILSFVLSVSWVFPKYCLNLVKI
jgi:O-antigen/teichoic acid export membrane protein